MDDTIEIIIGGPKRHGILCAGQILAQAAASQGLDVKTAEFSNEPKMSLELCHVRIGKNVYSPLIAQKQGNFIICSDVQFFGAVKEYLAPKSILIINARIYSKDNAVPATHVINASDIAEKTENMASLAFILMGYLSKFRAFPLTAASLTGSAKTILSSAENNLFLRYFQKGRDIPFSSE